MALVPRLAGLADENDEQLLRVLSKAERKLMLDLLMRMVEHHQLKQMPIE